MNELLLTLGRWFGNLKFYVTVNPWEQAIRVRAGKTILRLAPGLHFKIPFIDAVYRQSVRLRAAQMCTQTLTTMDGHTVVIGATLGFNIEDIERIYNRLHHADDTLTNKAAAALAETVYRTNRSDLHAQRLSDGVSADLSAEFHEFGVSGVDVRITDFAFIRAIRLVQDGRWMRTASEELETQKAHT